MRFRDYLVPIGILAAALFGGAAVAAAATSSSDAGKKNGDASKGKDGGNGKVRLVPKGGLKTTSQTGGTDQAVWARDRYMRSVAYLTSHGIDAATAREMSLSGLAHWAIETGHGTHEYNYNVGGIHARSGDQYFSSKEAASGDTANFAAYDSADQGIGDYWALLAAGYSDCLKLLHDAPTSDKWYRCLGENGYYAKANIDSGAKMLSDIRAGYSKSINGLVEGWSDVDYGPHALIGDMNDVGGQWAGSPTGPEAVHAADWHDVMGDDSERVIGGDSHTYGPYDQAKVDSMLATAKASGMQVTGANPWVLDPGQYGIKLQVTWDAASQMATVVVLSKSFYVSNDKIWAKLDAVMPH